MSFQNLTIVAPEPAAREGSQYFYRYAVHGGYYDAVRLKTTIPAKKTKQTPRETQTNRSTSCLVHAVILKTEKTFLLAFMPTSDYVPRRYE